MILFPIVSFLSFPLVLSPCLVPISLVPVLLLQQEIEDEMATEFHPCVFLKKKKLNMYLIFM